MQENINRQFFDLPEGIYALSHSVGPLTHSAKHALQDNFLQPWADCGGDAWPTWLSQIDKFCNVIARLINCCAEEVCPQTNLAAGFYAFLTAICKLPQHKHQNTIVMHKDAFASMGFVVGALRETFNLRLVLLEADANDIDAWYEAFETNQVLACLVTHVHSNTSIKSNVEQICRIAKQFEAFSCVDIAQSVGIVPVDVEVFKADAIFGSCVKWLCSGPGAGFMYVKRSLIEHLNPDPVGWFSHLNPFEFDIKHYQASPTAKRFWGGTPSVAPFIMATASIEQLMNIGMAKLVTHNHNLKKALLSYLPTDIAETIPDVQTLGGTLCLPLTRPIKAKNSIRTVTDEQILQAFIKSNIRVDSRNNYVRISLHIYNTIDDAEHIAKCFM